MTVDILSESGKQSAIQRSRPTVTFYDVFIIMIATALPKNIFVRSLQKMIIRQDLIILITD